MNCILAGVGGQGTVLASKLIAQAAMDRNLPVRTAETIGMAQRGGCVVSHVRVGASADDEIASPLIALGTADVVCAFEPGEATRALPYLKADGKMVAATGALMPVTASLKGGAYNPQAHLDYLRTSLGNRLTLIDTEKVLETFGSLKPLNLCLLGAACASGMLQTSIEEMEKALEKRVKPQFVDMNKRALVFGASQ